ncbi:MAG: twin-arginine translocase TatA/TatE family subunit, partial [Streptomyces sp.]|nr:twin-arginine translocase TatA/TatE family subunit [Streptomyces sp.]
LSELAVILIVVIAVLAAKRLPDLARSAGKSARILKSEARAMKDEEAADSPQPQVVQGQTVTPPSGSPTAPGQQPSSGADRTDGTTSGPEDGRKA